MREFTDLELYTIRGHANREAYLRYLAVVNDKTYEEVLKIANNLGRIEDFDDLVTALNDVK